jgi:hypothetical protein
MMPRNCIASWCITAKSGDMSFIASTFVAWRSVNRPRGLMQRAATGLVKADASGQP